MFKEFKEFINRGNVVDLAVGLILGAAFNAIVNSLVNDVIMPVIGYLFAGVDFSKLAIVLRAATAETEAVTINYGLLINALVNFLIVALVLFMIVKGFNKMRRAQVAEAAVEETPAPPTQEQLLQEILDEMKQQRKA